MFKIRLVERQHYTILFANMRWKNALFTICLRHPGRIDKRPRMFYNVGRRLCGMENGMRNSTLCYIERDGCYLMLHRIKRENDLNHDKWIGVGGGFLENESPEDCARREALEETGLILGRLRLCSVVTFVMEGAETEQMFLFKCHEFTGQLIECDEGILEWIEKKALYGMDIWEGDRIFLRMIEEDADFFTLKLEYAADGRLLSAVLNGAKNLLL